MEGQIEPAIRAITMINIQTLADRSMILTSRQPLSVALVVVAGQVHLQLTNFNFHT